MINHLLVEYCRENQIALSRSRPVNNNDNGWLEQKNGMQHVRRLVSHHRLSRGLQHRLLKDPYRVGSLWPDYFQPVVRRSRRSG